MRTLKYNIVTTIIIILSTQTSDRGINVFGNIHEIQFNITPK